MTPKKWKNWPQKLLIIGPEPFFPLSSPNHSPQPRIDFPYYEISGPDICSLICVTDATKYGKENQGKVNWGKVDSNNSTLLRKKYLDFINWRIAKIEIAVQMFTAKVRIFCSFSSISIFRRMKLPFESREYDCFKLKTDALFQ